MVLLSSAGNVRKEEVKTFVKKNKLHLFGLYETKIRKLNFLLYSKIFSPNFSIISNKANETDRDQILSG